jgi:conjugative transfer protein TraD
MSTEERKIDTRRRIQFGGLVVKAGLGAEDLAVILGILTAGGRVLNGHAGAEARRRWKEIGERAFGAGPSR